MALGRPDWSTYLGAATRAEIDGQMDAEIRRVAERYQWPLELPLKTDFFRAVVRLNTGMNLRTFGDNSETGRKIDGVTRYDPGSGEVKVGIHKRLLQPDHDQQLRIVLSHEGVHVMRHRIGPTPPDPQMLLFGEPKVVPEVTAFRRRDLKVQPKSQIEVEAEYGSESLIMPISLLRPFVEEFFLDRNIISKPAVHSAVGMELITLVDRKFLATVEFAATRLVALSYLATETFQDSLF